MLHQQKHTDDDRLVFKVQFKAGSDWRNSTCVGESTIGDLVDWRARFTMTTTTSIKSLAIFVWIPKSSVWSLLFFSTWCYSLYRASFSWCYTLGCMIFTHKHGCLGVLPCKACNSKTCDVIQQAILKETNSESPWNQSGWWFQPIWKICSSNWKSSPIFGVKINYIWVATTYQCLEEKNVLLGPGLFFGGLFFCCQFEGGLCQDVCLGHVSRGKINKKRLTFHWNIACLVIRILLMRYEKL